MASESSMNHFEHRRLIDHKWLATRSLELVLAGLDYSTTMAITRRAAEADATLHVVIRVAKSIQEETMERLQAYSADATSVNTVILHEQDSGSAAAAVATSSGPATFPPAPHAQALGAPPAAADDRLAAPYRRHALHAALVHDHAHRASDALRREPVEVPQDDPRVHAPASQQPRPAHGAEAEDGTRVRQRRWAIMTAAAEGCQHPALAGRARADFDHWTDFATGHAQLFKICVARCGLLPVRSTKR